MKLEAIAIAIVLSTLSGVLGNHRCPKIAESYDFIVVGAGSAGAAIAARLSEESKYTVLLIEAGKEPSKASTVPYTSGYELNTEMDWMYKSTKQKHCCGWFKNNQMPLHRGKALGGTSAINAMFYIRPKREDFEEWSSVGLEGWGYDENLKYFLRMEDYRVPATRAELEYHATGGPITVSNSMYRTTAHIAILEAGRELGLNLTDVNGPDPIGISEIHYSTRDGSRCSTYVGYLKPNLHRENFKILKSTLVTKLLINSDKEAEGVEYEWKKARCTVKANKEVIVSAGAYESPKLLMLSGIGPQDELAKFDIPLILDKPGVGQNMQDHLVGGNEAYGFNQRSTYNYLIEESARNKKLYDKYKTGSLTTPWGMDTWAFFPITYKNETKLVELIFCPNAILRFFKRYFNPLVYLALPTSPLESYYIFTVLLKPKSTGTVTLQSKNPHDHPLIDPNFLSHPDDIEFLMRAGAVAHQFMETKVMKKYKNYRPVGGWIPWCGEFSMGTVEYNRCVTAFTGVSIWHPVGTCKMGVEDDPMAVVDSRLRVIGISKLRVADSSIMPTVPAAHTNVVSIMIGEKTADMVKEDDE